MKKMFFVLIFLGLNLVNGQQKQSIILDWKLNTNYSSESFSFNIPTFQIRNFIFDNKTKSIFYVNKFSTNDEIAEKDFLVSDIVTEPISIEKLSDLDLNSIPKDINLKIINEKARDVLYYSIIFSPIIKEGNLYKKVISLNLDLKTSKNGKNYSVFSPNTISNSMLSNGNVYRFYVEKSGVYKLSKSFLQQLGLGVDGIDPKTIKIYGNGGRMLPLSNNVTYPIDNEENAIQIIGEADGIFNESDYILFYAEGTDNWNSENETHLNLYENKSFYYITTNAGQGKRISAMPTLTNGTPITNYDGYSFYEKDLFNIGRLGRKWYGEAFNITEEQNFDFSIPNIDSSVPITIKIATATAAFTTTKFIVKANTTDLGNINYGALGLGSGLLGQGNLATFSLPAIDIVKINLKFDNNSVPGSKAYLDYIVLQSKNLLKGFGKQFRFQYNQASAMTGVGDFQISNANSISQVWDITDIYNVQNITNNNQSTFSVKVNLGEIRKYIALDNNDFYTPNKESNTKVTNQNLKGTILKNQQGQFQDIDYIIVTPANLNSQAERLANFHRNYSNLVVKVVNLETIYQEFSSGKQDIGAIRNFIKYVFENASTTTKRLKYLCMFGDASFDPKNRIPNNTNIAPIFHSLDSFSIGSSYISDDFFVLLDANEGNMQDSSAKGLDVAVGRMIIRNAQQADQMVQKVIDYHDPKSYGRWRNNFVLISDDIDAPGEFVLQEGLDQLGDQIFAQKPFVNLKKIHADSYIQEASSGGNRYPKARIDFFNAFEQGALVFNYFGHGGEEGLASERLWNKNDGDLLSNPFKYPLFVTITCEFSRFDNPYQTSGGEVIYNNPKGGAIGLVTTTRKIDIFTGKNINDAFSANLYGFGATNQVSIAEALRVSKSNYSYNPLMVFYIGDPAIKLAIPKPTIILSKINDVSITQTTEVFRALSKIKISGEVRDENGTNILSNYNGEIAVNIFDKQIDRQTLGNDGATGGFPPQLQILNFTTLGETIFRGNASVTNGLFEFSFVVPRDIRVPIGAGRISFYSKKTNALIDQTGFNNTIQIGGVNTNAPTDNTAPIARLYMNDETFVNGGITNESPILLAFFEDDNGINTASGIGHDIVGILDGDETKPYILNDYYETEPDNYKKGKLKFPFRNLAVGLHTIKVKAWDVYNNPVIIELQFLVVGNDQITLTNVLNYPNPFVDYTQFWFTHNKPFEPLEVQVQVFTITGKVVWTKNQNITNEGFLSKDIIWDGKDDFGDRLGKGVYVYKLTVKSTLSDKKTEKFEKLVIL